MTPFPSRLLAYLVGMIFILSSLSKIWDVNYFIVQLAAYRLPFLGCLAVFTINVETLIGMLFILPIMAPKILKHTTGCFVIILTGIVVYGHARFGISDCGCFGKWLQLSPIETYFKNTLFLILIYASAPKAVMGKSAAGVLMAAIMLIANIAVVKQVDFKPSAASLEEVFVEKDGSTVSLASGDFLVALLTPCELCKKAVNPLNDLGENPNVPPIVGLLLGNEKDVQDLLKENPTFPVQTVSPSFFFKYLQGEPPTIMLIKDAKVIQVWKKKVPTEMELMRFI